MNAAARSKSGSTHRVHVKVKTWREVEEPPYAPKPWAGGGVMQVAAEVRSDRSRRKEQSRLETKARIVLDQLILEFPDRAYRARKEERLFDWLVAATIEKIDGELDREWLTNLARKQIEAGIQTKYLHASARERIIAQIRDSTLSRAGVGEFGRAA
jgi:hypothetical protein